MNILQLGRLCGPPAWSRMAALLLLGILLIACGGTGDEDDSSNNANGNLVDNSDAGDDDDDGSDDDDNDDNNDGRGDDGNDDDDKDDNDGNNTNGDLVNNNGNKDGEDNGNNTNSDLVNNGNNKDGEDNGNNNTNPVPNLPTDADKDGLIGAADNCPQVYNPEQRNTHGNASGDACEDSDGDGFTDAADVDADGDGLLDIHSLAEFQLVRNNLQGSSWVRTAGAPPANGNSTGCGGGTDAKGNNITSCQGYELFTDLDLGGIPNWQPIGGCSRINNCHAAFNGTFDGNGHSISNLRILSTANTYGVGLFGAISTADILSNNRLLVSPGKVRNLQLHNVIIFAASHAQTHYVGAVAGYGYEAELRNVSVTRADISGSTLVGGLVGEASYASIVSSHLAEASLAAGNQVGGLVGYGLGASIAGSYAEIHTLVAAGRGAGGLMGVGALAEVNSSYAKVDSILAGGPNVGGLIGNGFNAEVSSSYAATKAIHGQDSVGGLIGDGSSAQITSSYAETDIIRGGDSVGGLLGAGEFSRISSSYAWLLDLAGVNQLGGLVGKGNTAGRIDSSYALANSISGNASIGGLVGQLDIPSFAASQAILSNSYALTAELRAALPLVGGLIGNFSAKAQGFVQASYHWDGVRYTKSMPAGERQPPQHKSLRQLQNQTSFMDIYAGWDATQCVAGSAWVLGASNQLPVLSCFGANQTERAAALARQLNNHAEFISSNPRPPAIDSTACRGTTHLNVSIDAGISPTPAQENYLFYKANFTKSWLSSSNLLQHSAALQAELSLPCGEGYDFLALLADPMQARPTVCLMQSAKIARLHQAITLSNATSRASCPAVLPFGVAAVVEPEAVVFPAPDEIQPINNQEAVTAKLANATAADWYSFTLSKAQFATIYTTGRLDTYGELYRSEVPFPNAVDDDSGEFLNFRIQQTLAAGTYYLRVSSSSTSIAAAGVYELTLNLDTTGCRRIQVDENDYAERADGKDPLEPYQWYLDKHYVYDAWRKVPPERRGGKGIEIAVIDDNLQLDHEDLAANIIPGASIDVTAANASGELSRDQLYCNDAHGTAVAGIIAAVGDNRRGIRGIAYNAKLWGANFLRTISGGSATSGAIRSVHMHRLSRTAISSNSWGLFSPGELTPEEPSRLQSRLIEEGLKQGYVVAGEPRGVSYVYAAGNFRQIPGNPFSPLSLTSHQEVTNYRGVILVCAVGDDGRVSIYSNPGPNLWVCGYSDSGDNLNFTRFFDPTDPSAPDLHYYGMPTTDLSGTQAGYNFGSLTSVHYSSAFDECLRLGSFNFAAPLFIIDPICAADTPRVAPLRSSQELHWPSGTTASYNRYFGGTSGATPAVSGIVALMRAANPLLNWREVKLILAGSAWLPPGVNATAGAPTYHNPNERYAHHFDYGFGIANASKAVDLALNWRPVSPLLEWSSAAAGDRGLGYAELVYQPSAQNNITFVEFVNVEIIGGQEQPNFNNLDIRLISPNGQQSVLAIPYAYDCPGTACLAFRNAYIFGSAAHLGEDPQGQWRLQVNSTGDPGLDHLQWRLILHGHN